MKVIALRTVFYLAACSAGLSACGLPARAGEQAPAAAPSDPPAPPEDRAEPTNPFPVGEKLTYKVKWTWLSAGYATMSVVREEEFAGRKLSLIHI